MWYLEHIKEYKFISCSSYEHAIKELYRQWREQDGSIPWLIKYKPSYEYSESITIDI